MRKKKLIDTMRLKVELGLIDKITLEVSEELRKELGYGYVYFYKYKFNQLLREEFLLLDTE